MMHPACDVTRRSALGRHGVLGELYDARSDTFLSRRLLPNDEALRSHVDTQDTSRAAITFNMSDKLSDRLQLLRVEASLQLSVLAGMVQVSGSGKYIHDEKKSQKTVSGSLHYHVTTVSEKLMIDSQVEAMVDEAALLSTAATHFVTGIEWGADCTLSLMASDLDEQKMAEAEGALKGSLKKLETGCQVGGEGSAEWKDSETTKGVSFQLELHADVIPDGKIPTTVEEAVLFLSRVPELVRKVAGGRGKPLTFILQPLAVFRKFAPLSCVAQTITDSFVLHVVHFYEDLAEARRKLNDARADLEKHRKFVPENRLVALRDFSRRLDDRDIAFKSKLKDLIVGVRSGTVNISVAVAHVEESKGSELSIERIEDLVWSLKPELERVQLVELLRGQGASCLGNGEDLAQLLITTPPTTDVDILTTASRFKEDGRVYAKTLQVYLALLKDTARRHVVVDLDLAVTATLPAEARAAMRVVRCRGGDFVTTDLVAEMGVVGEAAPPRPNLARLRSDRSLVEEGEIRGDRCARLTLACPALGASGCLPLKLAWRCEGCAEDLVYGFEGVVACSCGLRRVADCEFRCGAESHGVEYVTADSEWLDQELATLSALPVMNILVVPQSGADPVRWVANLIALEGAAGRRGRPPPSEPELEGPVSSWTLFEDRAVNFTISPPPEHFAATIPQLGAIPHLQAIVLLLKPGQEKIPDDFRRDLTEFLSHFHRSAAANVVFCLTDPSASHIASARLLDSLNCAESVAMDERTIYHVPADGSARHEARRLLERIKTFPQHDMADTVAFLQARSTICRLSKPVAEILQIAQKNLAIIGNVEKLRLQKQSSVFHPLVSIIMSLSSLVSYGVENTLDIERMKSLQLIREDQVIHKEEVKQVVQIAASWRAFLTHTALAATRDVFRAALEDLLRQDNAKATTAVQRRAVERLKDELGRYEAAVSRAEGLGAAEAPTPREIGRQEHQLGEMKALGRTFKRRVQGLHLEPYFCPETIMHQGAFVTVKKPMFEYYKTK